MGAQILPALDELRKVHRLYRFLPKYNCFAINAAHDLALPYLVWAMHIAGGKLSTNSRPPYFGRRSLLFFARNRPFGCRWDQRMIWNRLTTGNANDLRHNKL